MEKSILETETQVLTRAIADSATGQLQLELGKLDAEVKTKGLKALSDKLDSAGDMPALEIARVLQAIKGLLGETSTSKVEVTQRVKPELEPLKDLSQEDLDLIARAIGQERPH